MKLINKVCQILALLFGVGALVLFFTDYATITSNGQAITLVGSQLAFGSKITFAGATVDMAISADLLFCMILTILAVVCSIFTFFAKGFGSRYASPAFSIVAGIYMLVVALRSPWLYVDTRPLENVTSVTYSIMVLLTSIALLLMAVAGVAHLLLADAIRVSESKGRLSIPQKIVHFFRDYKSETKKIVWPNLKSVLKNTGIVLLMCLIVGGFIWLLDFGLGQLLSLLLGV